MNKKCFIYLRIYYTLKNRLSGKKNRSLKNMGYIGVSVGFVELYLYGQLKRVIARENNRSDRCCIIKHPELLGFVGRSLSNKQASSLFCAEQGYSTAHVRESNITFQRQNRSRLFLKTAFLCCGQDAELDQLWKAVAMKAQLWHSYWTKLWFIL